MVMVQIYAETTDAFPNSVFVTPPTPHSIQRHCHVNFDWTAGCHPRDALYQSCRLQSARLPLPDAESLSQNCAIGIGGQQVLAGIEVAMDECVSGRKSWACRGDLPAGRARFTM